MFKDRSTSDIVVLLFALVISVVLIVMIVGAIIAKMIHPSLEMPNIIEAVTLMLANITGALVGWIGGKAAGKLEATNGK